MEIFRTETFKRQYKRLPPQIQEVCHKKLGFLLKDFRCPSLRAKKVKGHIDIREASLTMNYRFTFQIEEDVLILRKVGTYDILQNP